MAGRRAAAFLGIVLVGAGGALVGAAALTNEDVVRWFVTGTPEEELLRRIEAAEVDFDLAQDMLDEMRIAGLPDAVIRAMIRRQEEMEPAGEASGTETTDGGSRLLVRLNPGRQTDGDGPAAEIHTLNDVGPKLAERLGLKRSDLPITDLAIALFCRTADHVPDHWRSVSPLRDFNAPRHRMLAYVTGARARPAGKLRNMLSNLGKLPGARESTPGLEVLTLGVPDQLAVALDPGVAHDLTLGIAVRIGRRDYLTVADHLDGVVLGGAGDTTIRAVLRSPNHDPLEARVEFEKTNVENGP